ncbi:DUF4332 domain-containing protein [Candidatus Thorarchaeota archaeon]|nr:MAG: DUF4332 domain-containing protein [Candidatus Thorarchaeota archaeon]
MKRNHQSEVAINRCVDSTKQWEKFLQMIGTLERNSTIKDLHAFADYLNDERKIKPAMQGLSYYFKFLENNIMSQEASKIRGKYLKRNALNLKDFVGLTNDDITILKEKGITNANNILAAGTTEDKRKALAKDTGIPYDSILALVKMADLSRIFGVKGVRARLYVDSGIDTVEKMSEANSEELIATTSSFIERTNFPGIPPTQKEAKSAIETAKKILKNIDY